MDDRLPAAAASEPHLPVAVARASCLQPALLRLLPRMDPAPFPRLSLPLLLSLLCRLHGPGHAELI